MRFAGLRPRRSPAPISRLRRRWRSELCGRNQRFGKPGFRIKCRSCRSCGIGWTPWNHIVGLYDLLARVSASPVVGLNRAVAVAMRDGPVAGLALMDAIIERDLSEYHWAHSARAELCRRLGRVAEARDAYERALALTQLGPERRFLERRLAGPEPRHSVDVNAPRCQSRALRDPAGGGLGRYDPRERAATGQGGTGLMTRMTRTMRSGWRVRPGDANVATLLIRRPRVRDQRCPSLAADAGVDRDADAGFAVSADAPVIPALLAFVPGDDFGWCPR